MKSVKSVLIDWLKQFPKIELTEPILNEIVDGDKSYGITKEPTKIEKEFCDGSKVITEYYTFFAKRLVTNNKFRKQNDDFLEELEEWIRNQEYPDLGKGKHCDKIAIENGGSLLSVSDRYGMYTITIEIEYRKD